MHLIIAVYTKNDKKDLYVGIFQNTLNSNPKFQYALKGETDGKAEFAILVQINKILLMQMPKNYVIDFFKGLKIIRRNNNKFIFLESFAPFFVLEVIQNKI